MSVWFLVRVELHKHSDGPDLTRADYDSLHREMESNNFKRTIRSDDGIDYHLPPAEYFFEARNNITAGQVHDALRSILNYFPITCSILVVETPSLAWSGLAPVSRVSALLGRI